MSASHLTRLRNEIASLEKESQRIIPSNTYYVVVICLADGEIDINEWGKNAILNSENQPLFVYVRQNEIFLFFSCLEEEPHYLSGNHQSICSKYTFEYSQKLAQAKSLGVASAKIVELETQNQIFTYLLWKNTECSFKRLSELLDIPLEKVYQRTIEELTAMVEGQTWDSLPKTEKFGTVYKLKEKRGKTVLSSFSKRLDSRRKGHYLNYLFA